MHEYFINQNQSYFLPSSLFISDCFLVSRWHMMECILDKDGIMYQCYMVTSVVLSYSLQIHNWLYEFLWTALLVMPLTLAGLNPYLFCLVQFCAKHQQFMKTDVLGYNSFRDSYTDSVRQANRRPWYGKSCAAALWLYCTMFQMLQPSSHQRLAGDNTDT